MSDKDVELLLDKGVLTIRGQKKGERDERGYSERWYGRFERQIPLPASVEEEKCKADFSDGVLTVHLPKSAEAEDRKRIPINAATRH
jgi:HSP20 family protein